MAEGRGVQLIFPMSLHETVSSWLKFLLSANTGADFPGVLLLLLLLFIFCVEILLILKAIVS